MKIQPVDESGRGGSWRGVLLFAAFFVALTVRPSDAQGGKPRKFDAPLRQAIEQADADVDERPVKVIVTMRPGARAAVRQKVGKHGGRVTSEFGVINGSAVELKPRHLKELENDSDVVSISVDADVQADGVASSITGTPQGGAYNLRSTLGLRGVSATSTTTDVPTGQLGWLRGTADGGVNSGSAGTSYGTAASVKVEVSSSAKRGMLLRFDNLFGTGAGQIPPGSTITVRDVAGDDRGRRDHVRRDTPAPHAYSVGPSTTWNSLATSGAGLQLDDVEAASSADASVTATTTGGSLPSAVLR